MGLDITLGIMVLIGAFRGWFRGFVLQAIRLSGMVGGVYSAGPLRDYVRPHVVPYLASVPPAMLDRLLWWSSAVVSYLTMVGLATLAVKLYRKRPYGEPEPNHADQFAGMLLAAGKSAVAAAFLVAALDKHALVYVKQVAWATEMTKSSTVLTWNEQYRPSEKIWTAAPVQHFVGYVRKMGIDKPPGATSEDPRGSLSPRSRPRTAPVGSTCRPSMLSTRVRSNSSRRWTRRCGSSTFLEPGRSITCVDRSHPPRQTPSLGPRSGRRRLEHGDGDNPGPGRR